MNNNQEINTVQVWCGYRTVDEFGRLGELYGVYRNEADADVGVVGIGWYGGSGRVIKKSAIESGYDLYILESEKPQCFKDVTELREELRLKKLEAALNKLTKEEIEILRGEFK